MPIKISNCKRTFLIGSDKIATQLTNMANEDKDVGSLRRLHEVSEITSVFLITIQREYIFVTSCL